MINERNLQVWHRAQKGNRLARDKRRRGDRRQTEAVERVCDFRVQAGWREKTRVKLATSVEELLACLAEWSIDQPAHDH